MGEWFTVVKRIRGTPYLYLQKTERVPGRKHPVAHICLGPMFDGSAPKKKKPESEAVRGALFAIFGAEDEYGQKRDSLWNRHVNKSVPVKPGMPTGRAAEDDPAKAKKEPAAENAAGEGSKTVSSGDA